MLIHAIHSSRFFNYCANSHNNILIFQKWKWNLRGPRTHKNDKTRVRFEVKRNKRQGRAPLKRFRKKKRKRTQFTKTDILCDFAQFLGILFNKSPLNWMVKCYMCSILNFMVVREFFADLVPTPLENGLKLALSCPSRMRVGVRSDIKLISGNKLNLSR